MGIDFIHGERKHIRFIVRGRNVVIINASYCLYRGSEMIEHGECTIEEENSILLLLQSPEVGSYTLEVSYNVPPELRKVRCEINVY